MQKCAQDQLAYKLARHVEVGGSNVTNTHNESVGILS